VRRALASRVARAAAGSSAGQASLVPITRMLRLLPGDLREVPHSRRGMNQSRRDRLSLPRPQPPGGPMEGSLRTRIRDSSGVAIAPRPRARRDQAILSEPSRGETASPILRRARPTYARRLLHRDVDRGWTAVVMTWGPAGVMLHDTPASGAWRDDRGEMDVVGPRSTARRPPPPRRAPFPAPGALIRSSTTSAQRLADAPRSPSVYGGEMDHATASGAGGAGTGASTGASPTGAGGRTPAAARRPRRRWHAVAPAFAW
jgi:hypothetical protein